MPSRPRRREPPLPVGVEVDHVTRLAGDEPFGLDADAGRILAMVSSGVRPVLIGPSEIGKTAIVRAMAARMRREGRFHAMWEVSLRAVDLASSKEPGMPAQLFEIVRAAVTSPKRPILFFSDLRMLRAYDLGFALTDLLQRFPVPVVAEAGPSFLAWLTEDSELARTFVPVRIEEPTESVTLERVNAVAARHHVELLPSAAAACITLSQRLQPMRRLPGKALALLEGAIARARGAGESQVDERRVADAASDLLRIPRALIAPSPPLDREGLRRSLLSGNENAEGAIDAIADALVAFRTGTHDMVHPLGVFLLAGVPGSGKTSFVRDVARAILGDAGRVVHIPLAEHAEEWKAEQLFGQRASPHPEGRHGILSRALSGRGFAIILLDEIDKAHPMIVRHLYRALDTGMFIDGNDEPVLLRNALVFVTAALPSDVVDARSFGFSPRSSAQDNALDSVRRRLGASLTAELLDRFDGVFVFASPEGETLASTARALLERIAARPGFAQRHVAIDAGEDVVGLLCKRAQAAPAGGSTLRALRRTIDALLTVPIATRLDAGEIPDGSVVRASVVDGRVALDVVVQPLDARRAGTNTPSAVRKADFVGARTPVLPSTTRAKRATP